MQKYIILIIVILIVIFGCYIISNIFSMFGGDIRDGIEDFLYDNNIDK